MTDRNRRFVLAAYPVGEPRLDDFRLEETAVPEPGPGQLLLRTMWLSLDPYMRGRMSTAKSYSRGLAIGEVIMGGTVSVVERSHHAGYGAGDIVLSYAGWQDYALSDGQGLRKLDPAAAPVSTALGVLGMPGMTAYTGLRLIGQPKPGETVVVAAAAGPVGSLVGQLARQAGCRAVGIAGGAEKCRAVIEEFGFDAAVDHHDPKMAERLAQSCPGGIDVYFENVGGEVFKAVVPLLNDFARIPVCGLIAHYNATQAPAGPDRLPGLMRDILTKRLTLRGFIVTDFAAHEGEFLRDVGAGLRAGTIRYREDIVEGLAHAPEAFIGLLRGRNFGKMLVRVAPMP